LQGPPGTGKTREAKELAIEILGLEDVKELVDSERFKLIQFHPSYTYEDFVRGIVTIPNKSGEGILYKAANKVLGDFAKKALTSLTENTGEDEDNINYVLIIDEINRANLSSVLGELIYALEYRGESVESMYAIGDDNKLILPPNLYIIGTMNTADRSVGHIDYAIRRRFAFVNILPQKLGDTEKIYFNTNGYEAVEKLFNPAVVSHDFDPADVQLGHSYFIANRIEAISEEKKKAIFTMKMEYEVIPILKEYLKDGVFVAGVQIEGKSINEYIDSLINDRD
jgi:5-methylcytosine-specific restriction enzyme B